MVTATLTTFLTKYNKPTSYNYSHHNNNEEKKRNDFQIR